MEGRSNEARQFEVVVEEQLGIQSGHDAQATFIGVLQSAIHSAQSKATCPLLSLTW